LADSANRGDRAGLGVDLPDRHRLAAEVAGTDIDISRVGADGDALRNRTEFNRANKLAGRGVDDPQLVTRQNVDLAGSLPTMKTSRGDTPSAKVMVFPVAGRTSTVTSRRSCPPWPSLAVMTTMACLSAVDAPIAAACWRACAEGSNVKLPLLSIVTVPSVLVMA
jgi:hypothetical protein